MGHPHPLVQLVCKNPLQPLIHLHILQLHWGATFCNFLFSSCTFMIGCRVALKLQKVAHTATHIKYNKIIYLY